MVSIYVGNLSFKSTEQDLQALFAQYGSVDNVKIIKDRETGRPRGFAFVEMEQEAGTAAVTALNGAMFDGRRIKVNEAKAKENSPRNKNGNEE